MTPVSLHLVLCRALEAAIFRCGIHEGGRVGPGRRLDALYREGSGAVIDEVAIAGRPEVEADPEEPVEGDTRQCAFKSDPV